MEKLGLNKEANSSFARLAMRMEKLKGSKEEKERRVFEYYPSFDSVELRLATTSYALGKRASAVDYLKKIKNVDSLKPNEIHDYYVTLSKLSFDAKDYKNALDLVLVARKVEISDKEKRDKFHVYLSRVYEKNGQFDEAIAFLEKYYDESKSKGDRDQIYVQSRLFHAYKEKGMVEKAIETGEQLLADYETKYDLDKERFHLGELHYMNNSLNKAEKVWKDLDKKGVWAELARNKVEADQWSKQTNESLKRIPAMAQ